MPLDYSFPYSSFVPEPIKPHIFLHMEILNPSSLVPLKMGETFAERNLCLIGSAVDRPKGYSPLFSNPCRSRFLDGWDLGHPTMAKLFSHRIIVQFPNIWNNGVSKYRFYFDSAPSNIRIATSLTAVWLRCASHSRAHVDEM